MVIEGDVSAARWPLKRSDTSYLSAFSANIGPVFLLPAIIPVIPYAGCSVQATYFSLNADRIGESETALRPGIVLKSGIFADLAYGVGARAGVEYSAVPLSGRIFGAVALSASAVMRYHAISGERAYSGDYGEDRKIEVEILSNRARKELENGNAAKAKELFGKVLRLDGHNVDAHKYLAEIDRFEAQYSLGSALFEEKRYLEALPALEEASRGIREAAEKLSRARAILIVNIPAWEKSGVDEYEKKNYDGCIYHMEKILLVDPENQTARIYLPRAKNRKGALEKLK